MDFEFLIRSGPEGDDVDSCGMNMIGEIPAGFSLRRLSTRDVRLRSPRPVATSNDPASCRAGKRNRPLEDLSLNKYLEMKSSTNGSFSVTINIEI